MICSIGAVSATDLNDNSTVEVTSSVDDSISVDEASIIDVGQNQEVASTSAATWDELKTACQSSGDKVITLTGQSYNANSQIVFGNSATIIGSSDTYITTNNDDNVTSPQWAMTGHDAQNSGQSPYNGIKSLKVLWSNSLALISSPIIDEEGNIYVVYGNTISSFYNNGTLRWNVNSWMPAGIALYNDYIIAPESGNKLTIVNKTTGKEVSGNIWQLSSAFTPIVDSEGNIYVSHEYPYNGPGSVSGSHWVGVASYNNDTTSPSYGYDFSASLIKLSKNPSYGKPGTLSAPVLDKLGNVWVNTIEGIIGANIKSGDNIVKISNAGTSGRPVVGDNNVVYCFGNNNVIFALNAGGIIWNTTVPDGIGKVLAIDNENNVLYTVNAKGMVI